MGGKRLSKYPRPPTTMDIRISKQQGKVCDFCGDEIAVGQTLYTIHKGNKWYESTGRYHALYDTKECITAHANQIYEYGKNLRKLQKAQA